MAHSLSLVYPDNGFNRWWERHNEFISVYFFLTALPQVSSPMEFQFPANSEELLLVWLCINASIHPQPTAQDITWLPPFGAIVHGEELSPGSGDCLNATLLVEQNEITSTGQEYSVIVTTVGRSVNASITVEPESEYFPFFVYCKQQVFFTNLMVCLFTLLARSSRKFCSEEKRSGKIILKYMRRGPGSHSTSPCDRHVANLMSKHTKSHRSPLISSNSEASSAWQCLQVLEEGKQMLFQKLGDSSSFGRWSTNAL